MTILVGVILREMMGDINLLLVSCLGEERETMCGEEVDHEGKAFPISN